MIKAAVRKISCAELSNHKNKNKKPMAYHIILINLNYIGLTSDENIKKSEQDSSTLN